MVNKLRTHRIATMLILVAALLAPLTPATEATTPEGSTNPPWCRYLPVPLMCQLK